MNQQQNQSSGEQNPNKTPTRVVEASNLQELSHSVLHTPQQISEFNKKRGYLDVNRLLRAPVYNSNVQSNAQQDRFTTPHGQNNFQNPSDLSSNTQVLWGTNINTNDVAAKMRNFINTFIVVTEDVEDFTQAPYYVEQLKQIRDTEIYMLDIDCDHIYQFDQLLYRQIECYPADVIPIFDLVVTQVFKELYVMQGGIADSNGIQNSNLALDDQSLNQVIQVRPFNLRKVYKIREMDPSHVEKLITIKGIVIRCSEVVPEMKEANFKCGKCFTAEYKFLERGRIIEPDFCSNCRNRGTFQLMHNSCMFSDKQHIKLQETPESVPEGETPQTINLCAYEDLVDFVKPGDRIEIIGIYKAMGIRQNSQKRTLKQVYRTYIDVINYVKTDKKRYNMDTNDNKEDLMEVDEGAIQDQVLKEEHTLFTEHQISRFKQFSQDPLVYDKLVDAFAPSIWENQDVKKGILCQLFGGCSKEFSQSGRGRFRGEINILLCGDPSTAKSQLLQYVHKIAPRGIYTSGKGSSAVGLTVYVTKDPETKEVILESGALVLSDRGICCIDEFDKMDDNTRVILHEAMEQQTVSVAKAGIICTLNARTAILAAANPIHSKYDPKLSVVENIKLPPTLLSRFDLIYLILDRQNDATDRRLANHLVSLYSTPLDPNKEKYQSTQLIESNHIEREFFASYISYARKFCSPTIPDYVVMDLVQEYTKMRSLGNNKKTITATPRQLESMIRIAEAIAKMRLSETVEKRDVEEAVRLIKTAMQQSATDPATGEIDMDIIATGVSSTSQDRIKQIGGIIKKIYQDYKERVKKSGIQYHNLFEYVNNKVSETMNVVSQMNSLTVYNQQNTKQSKQSVNEQEFRDALRQLEEENMISLFGHSKNPTVRFLVE